MKIAMCKLSNESTLFLKRYFQIFGIIVILGFDVKGWDQGFFSYSNLNISRFLYSLK